MSGWVAKVAFFLMAVVCLSASNTRGQAVPEWKPSKSDADISAIGNRDVGKGLDFYSLEHEKDLGKELAKQIERTSKLVNDPMILGYVDSVGQRLARNSDVRMPVTFRVIDTDFAGAFTLPGGFQYVDRGLLVRLESEAELAGVLAHGLGHTAMRSATKRATKEEITQLALIPAMIYVPVDWPGTSLQPAGMNFMIPVTYLKRERLEELAADYFGLQYVYVTGYDPEAYVDLMQRVSPQPPSGKKTDPFSNSPPLAVRLAAMQKEIAAILPKKDDAVVSTSEFRSFQEHVLAWKPKQ